MYIMLPRHFHSLVKGFDFLILTSRLVRYFFSSKEQLQKLTEILKLVWSMYLKEILKIEFLE